MKLHRLTIALALLCALAFGACNGKSITGPPDPDETPTPTPAPQPGTCPFQIGIEPLRVVGAYFVKAEPPGPVTIIIGTTIYGAPSEGIIVYGSRGDVVSACRPCGCAQPVALP